MFFLKECQRRRAADERGELDVTVRRAHPVMTLLIPALCWASRGVVNVTSDRELSFVWEWQSESCMSREGSPSTSPKRWPR